MKRFWWLFVGICLLLVGCDDEIGASRTGAEEDLGIQKEISDFNESTNIVKYVEEFTYEIPQTWQEIADDSTRNSWQFTINGVGGGMCVDVFSLEHSLLSEAGKEEYIEAISRDKEGFKITSSSETTVGGTQALKLEILFTVNNEMWYTNLVAFECERGWISFYMQVPSGAEYTCNGDFEKVISSIKNIESEDWTIQIKQVVNGKIPNAEVKIAEQDSGLYISLDNINSAKELSVESFIDTAEECYKIFKDNNISYESLIFSTITDQTEMISIVILKKGANGYSSSLTVVGVDENAYKAEYLESSVFSVIDADNQYEEDLDNIVNKYS